LERLGEPFDLTAINAGDVRMNVRDIDWRPGKLGAQFVFSCLKLYQSRH
jgi:hypothetical protein